MWKLLLGKRKMVQQTRWSQTCVRASSHVDFYVQVVVEQRDVSPGKASFPPQLPGIYRLPAVCLQHLWRHQEEPSAASGEHIWVEREQGVCGKEGGGGHKEILQGTLQGLTIQNRPLEECHSELPTPGNVSNWIRGFDERLLKLKHCDCGEGHVIASMWLLET